MLILTRRPGEPIFIETPAGERIHVAGTQRDLSWRRLFKAALVNRITIITLNSYN